MDQTGQLLQLETWKIIFILVCLCFAEITRKYKWVGNEDRQNKLYPIIEQAFPHLLSIGGVILNTENDRIKSRDFEIILKLYKFVTYYDLPEPLRSKDAVISWGEFHGSVINMTPPSYVLGTNILEQEKLFLQISNVINGLLPTFIDYLFVMQVLRT